MTRQQAIETAQQFIRAAQPLNPDLKFARTDSGATIGVWSDQDAAYLPAAELTLFGTWVAPHGCQVNGQPIPRTWIPVA